MAAPSNDKGQRYEIRANNGEGKPLVIGWTNDPSGGGIIDRIQAHPALFDPEIIDRFPEIDKLIEFRRFKAGCRKCVSDVYAGRERCRYCNTRFPVMAHA